MTGVAAGFTPNMLPGFFFGLISLWVSRCGNRCDRPDLIVDADVGVLHRHADVAVAGQLTGFDKGCTVTQQLGYVSVPSHRWAENESAHQQHRYDNSITVHDPSPVLP